MCNVSRIKVDQLIKEFPEIKFNNDILNFIKNEYPEIYNEYKNVIERDRIQSVKERNKRINKILKK